MTQLSEHFSLEEMIATSHTGFDQVPSAAIVAALTVTCATLEAVRTVLGNRPMHVTSGYRCPGLNAAVGGVSDSAHLFGFAADFVCPAFGSPLDICRALDASSIDWDQIIEEGTWTHISTDPRLRGEVLTKAAGGGYQAGLPK